MKASKSKQYRSIWVSTIVASLAACSDPHEPEGGAHAEVTAALRPRVPPRARVIQVVAGAGHTCALFAAGNVRCWGGNGSGQLGYGNTVSIGDDDLVTTDVNVGGKVIQLTAGPSHTCALLKRGAVRCWGSNAYGELGYGNTNNIGDDEEPASAGDVNVGSVTQIAAGQDHTCALLTRGRVRCWGAGWVGLLGYGNTDNIGDDETPADAGNIHLGGKAVKVEAGSTRTCAILDTGALRCWGAANVGALGYPGLGDIGDNETPADAGDIDVGGKVIDVDMGFYHTCALLTSGAVRCWGDGYFGALGYGNTNHVGIDVTPASVGDVPIGAAVSALGCMGYGTCVVRAYDGGVVCWGLNTSGELGQGNTEQLGDDETPAEIDTIVLGDKAESIEGGEFHNCVVTPLGTVRCWGLSWAGQLGYGNTNSIGDDEYPAVAGPVPLR